MEQIRNVEDEQSLLAHVFLHSPIGMALAAPDGRWLRANPVLCEIVGYSEEELLNLNIQTITHPDDWAVESEYAAQISEYRRDAYRMEKRCIHKDGRAVWVQQTVSRVKDDRGIRPCILVQVKDISEPKLAEQLLREAEKLSLVGRMAAGIAHEIRNPLTAIKGFLQLIQGTKNVKPEYFEIIESEFDRIESILKELLTLAKPQETRFRRADLMQIQREVVSLLQMQAILNNVVIASESDQAALPLDCDPNRLKQVLINLLKNAIEAMPRGGEIRIRTKAEGNHVHLFITDQGGGIPKPVLERLGEPFHTTKENGTGLGIMVSRDIIAAHGGSISIRSEEGQGTTFEIVLPLTHESREFQA